MSSVLKPVGYTVEAQGSLVCLTLGNVPIRMDYNTALQMAQMLRLKGREAKRNAGDTSMTIRGRGMLTDANADELRHQGQRDSTAKFN